MQINGICCSSVFMAFLFPPASPNHRSTSHSTGDPSVSSKTLNQNPGREPLLIFSPSSPFGSPSLFFHAPLPVSWRFQSRFLCWSQGFMYVKSSLSICWIKGWRVQPEIYSRRPYSLKCSMLIYRIITFLICEILRRSLHLQNWFPTDRISASMQAVKYLRRMSVNCTYLVYFPSRPYKHHKGNDLFPLSVFNSWQSSWHRSVQQMLMSSSLGSFHPQIL